MSKIFMPVFTVAEWGGLHEYALAAADMLKRAGHEVLFAGTPGRVTDVARSMKISTLDVDWHDSSGSTMSSAVQWDADLVFAQPFRSRVLGMAVAAESNIPFVPMFHGYAHDSAFVWHERAARILTTSPSISAMLVRYCFVPASKLQVIPNGAPSHLLELESREPEANADHLSIALVSRLSHDKFGMIEAALEVVASVRDVYDGHITLDVVGDGPLRYEFDYHLHRGVRDDERCTVEMHGWMDPAEVPAILSEAFVSVGAGRSALQSVALGTPVYGAGARASIGIPDVEQIDAAVSCNFGDYLPVGRLAEPLSPRDLLDPGRYSDLAKSGRELVRLKYTQDRTDEILRVALTEVL
ncbi:glycosyltransferase family 4 protein [Isoptericola sp. 178]|uniref:glycosyltransferase family 4 protein n=1 Tax=Isoptericola sp. 178 TaxID=3064651 RepID=UPI002713F804|nr:glycosyltransferase family 4 protein [Isoptericola sp. 178]MDO8143935.1 glycosyltransferase family 4 protein [Isoptericola sp. 178]